MALRWKKNSAEKGLARIGAGPRGSKLRDGDVEYASVYALRQNYQVKGWYWVVGTQQGMPHKNTCNTPSATEAEAKTAAMAYVRACIKAQEGTK